MFTDGNRGFMSSQIVQNFSEMSVHL